MTDWRRVWGVVCSGGSAGNVCPATGVFSEERAGFSEDIEVSSRGEVCQRVLLSFCGLMGNEFARNVWVVARVERKNRSHRRIFRHS
jgi:hypothetical protein